MLKKILKKLFSKYHEFIDVFLLKKTDQFSSYCFFNHKIELKSKKNLLYYKNQSMSAKKLKIIKKFLNKYLQKNLFKSVYYQ